MQANIRKTLARIPDKLYEIRTTATRTTGTDSFLLLPLCFAFMWSSLYHDVTTSLYIMWRVEAPPR